MTKKEAEQLLQLKQFESIEEAIEHFIFPIKTFLLTAPILEKTFHSKVNRLQLLVEILACLHVEKQKEPLDLSNVELLIQAEVLPTYIAYEKVISIYYLNISSSQNPSELLSICKNLLRIQSLYVAMWRKYSFEFVGTVLLSKPLDRMTFHLILKNLFESGIKTWEEMATKQASLPLEFRMEIERIRQSVT